MKNFAIFIGFLLIVLVLFFFLNKKEDGVKEKLSEVHLNSARDDLRVFDSLGNDFLSDSRRILAQSILKKIIIVRNLEPDIDLISGRGLEVLCTLSESFEIFDLAESDGLALIAKQYLSSIEAQVKDRISMLQKSMKGKGCLMSPGG